MNELDRMRIIDPGNTRWMFESWPDEERARVPGSRKRRSNAWMMAVVFRPDRTEEKCPLIIRDSVSGPSFHRRRLLHV